MRRERRFLRILAMMGLALVAIIGVTLVAYRPDRPVPVIEPGSSAGPTFVVQIIRPRLGLPLGGLLPPHLFGLEGHLGFDSTTPGASLRSVGRRRLEIDAPGWRVVIAVGEDGRLSPDTHVVLDMTYEDRLRRIRCRPAVEPEGTFTATSLTGSTELSGSFDVELSRCEDAVTGEPLAWPPSPLILHGSFDRLAPSPK